MTALHTQNKGEWSEFYAFLKIISDGELLVLDREDAAATKVAVVRVRKNAQAFLPNKAAIYRIAPGGTLVKPKLYPLGNTALARDCVASLLAKIQQSSGTFVHSDSEILAEKLGISVKSDTSQSKGDLALQFVRPDSGQPSALHEVSVKSWFGGDPTLFNASSRGTKLVYAVEGAPSSTLKRLFLEKSKPKETLSAILATGGRVEFLEFFSPEMSENARSLRATEAIAHLVLSHYKKTVSGRSTMPYVVSQARLADQKPVRAALREFLRAAALGMTSSSTWDLKMSASDNYLLVSSTGDLICILGRNKLEEFLYGLAYVDTPSTKRYDFGYPYETGKGWRLALNFQLRLSSNWGALPFNTGRST